MYYVPDGTTKCGFYECKSCKSRFLSLQTMKKIQNTNKTKEKLNKATKHLRVAKYALMTILIIMSFATPVLADDPLSAINGLSTFIFSAIKAIGMILLGFGIVQIGLSLKSHDASQRANGFLTFFGGVIIAFAKDILDLIL